MTSSGAIEVSGGGALKGKGAAVAEVKNKVDGSGKPVSIVMKKPVNVVIKPERKKITSSSNTVIKNNKSESSEESVFLAWSKREPLRMFYESSLEQIPSSEMAEFWIMEHGLLSPQRAKKA
ncbi:hypothetical protein OPV22_014220 [Ensete ventricosum]|uniref:Uncharacterized protein n=1 Tax=Ensete ventricosum TaxID=4639 RepID=A0AAV8PPS8_ENSVE|nr:hypothetical protein OPV22_014220 [Ensete ventricosum]